MGRNRRNIWSQKDVDKLKGKEKSGGKKYNNVKYITVDGIEADSTLEGVFYDLLRKWKVDFEYQYYFPLQEPFTDPDGKAVKKISVTVDFYIKDYEEDGIKKELIIDTKGHCTEPSILRYKMLEYQLQQQGRPYILIFPRERSNAQSLSVRIWKGMKLSGMYTKQKPY